VIFAPDAARVLLVQFAGVMSGGAIWRRSSYLAGREGTAVASPLIEIVDDPLLRRGPGSRPFDGEGLASRTNVLVSGGLLRTYLCDVYAALKAGAPFDRVGVARHRRQPARMSNLILRREHPRRRSEKSIAPCTSPI
jgi:predicted Zn-dependent protease